MFDNYFKIGGLTIQNPPPVPQAEEEERPREKSRSSTKRRSSLEAGVYSQKNAKQPQNRVSSTGSNTVAKQKQPVFQKIVPGLDLNQLDKKKFLKFHQYQSQPETMRIAAAKKVDAQSHRHKKQKLLSISGDKNSNGVNNLSQIQNKTQNQTSKASIERDIKFLNDK